MNMLWFHATNVQSPGWIIFTRKISFDRYDHKILIDESECIRNWKTEQTKKVQKQNKGRYIYAFYRNPVFWKKTIITSREQVTPPIKILMLTYHNGVKQELMKSKILKCVSVGEKSMLRLQMRN